MTYPQLPADALAAAEADVTDAQTLWREFVDELSRYGTTQPMSDGVRFAQRHETTARTFAISPAQLRSALVHDLAYTRLRGQDPPPVRRLPQWFLDGIVEFVGSNEEPYDVGYVILAGASLAPSADGREPVGGPPPTLPDPPSTPDGTQDASPG